MSLLFETSLDISSKKSGLNLNLKLLRLVISPFVKLSLKIIFTCYLKVHGKTKSNNDQGNFRKQLQLVLLLSFTFLLGWVRAPELQRRNDQSQSAEMTKKQEPLLNKEDMKFWCSHLSYF